MRPNIALNNQNEEMDSQGVNTGDPNVKVDMSTIAGSTSGATASTSGLPENNPSTDPDVNQILFSDVPDASEQEKQLINKRAKELYGQPDILFNESTTTDFYPAPLQAVQQVGTYSGSVIGSNPLFGSTPNVLPMGAILEKKKAKAKAAAAKAKAMAEIKLPDTPQYKKAIWEQKNLNDQVDAAIPYYWDVAAKNFGEENAKFALMSTDTKVGREFQKFMRDMNTVVSQGDFVAEQLAEVDKNIKEGGVVYSPELLQIRDEVYKAQNDAAREDILSPQKLAKYVDKMKEFQGYVSMDKMFDDRGLDQIKGELIARGGVNNIGEYIELVKTKKVNFDRDVDAIVENLVAPGGELFPHIKDGVLTKDQIKKQLKSRLGTIDEQSKDIKFKPGAAGSGVIKKDELSGSAQSAGRYQYSVVNKNGKLVNANISMRMGQTMPESSKPFSIANVSYIDETGKEVRIPNNQKIKLVQGGIYSPPGEEGKYLVEKPVFVAQVEQVKTVQVPQMKKLQNPIKNEQGELVYEEPILDEYENPLYKTEKQTVINNLPLVLDERLESSILANWSSLGFDSIDTAKELLSTMKKDAKSEYSPTFGEKKVEKKPQAY